MVCVCAERRVLPSQLRVNDVFKGPNALVYYSIFSLRRGHSRFVSFCGPRWFGIVSLVAHYGHTKLHNRVPLYLANVPIKQFSS